MFHKHIAQKIANKTEENYEKVQTLIRCKLSFLVLRSVLLCIKGSLSISKDSVVLDDVSLTCSAAGLFWFVYIHWHVTFWDLTACFLFWAIVSHLFWFFFDAFFLFVSCIIFLISHILLGLWYVSCLFLIFCCFGVCMLVKSWFVLIVNK